MTELKPRLNQVLIFSVSFLASLGFLIFTIHVINNRPEDLKNLEDILFFILFIVVLGLPLFLSITYFFEDLTKKVIIDEQNNRLIIRKKGKESVISKNDIVESYFVIGDWGGRRFNFQSYKYIMIILRERKRVCITSLVYDPENIIKFFNLKPTSFEPFIPFIDWKLGEGVLTSNEYELKVLEFENNFKDHSNAMLVSIVNQRFVYADYAREAAARILKKRKQNVNTNTA